MLSVYLGPKEITFSRIYCNCHNNLIKKIFCELILLEISVDRELLDNVQDSKTKVGPISIIEDFGTNLSEIELLEKSILNYVSKC